MPNIMLSFHFTKKCQLRDNELCMLEILNVLLCSYAVATVLVPFLALVLFESVSSGGYRPILNYSKICDEM